MPLIEKSKSSPGGNSSHCGPLKPSPPKYDVTLPPSCKNWYTETMEDVNTEKCENFDSQLHQSSKSQVWGSVDL